MGKFLLGILGQIVNVINGGVNGAVASLVSMLKLGTRNLFQFHQEGIATAREMGMTLQQSQAYTRTLTERATELGVKYGIAARQVVELQKNLAQANGRAMMLSDQEAERMVQINKLVGAGTSSEFTSTIMRNLGGQLSTVQGAIAKSYQTAMKNGLSAAQFSEKVAKNLTLANKLSFRNGIDGIIKMTALSEKLGFNLQSVDAAANRFMDLDKAIENSAGLQMLGGAAASYGGNPLTMAYEANYDPEAFTERMTKMLGGYATFDTEKGIANVNGISRDFVKSIAERMGIGLDEAMSIAKKQAEVSYKESKFSAELNRYSGGDEGIRNFLINRSQVSGNSLVMTNRSGQTRDLEYYTSGEGKKELDEMIRISNMSSEDLMAEQAMQLTSINEELEGLETTLYGAVAKVLEPFLGPLKGTVDEGAKGLAQLVTSAAEKIAPYVPEFIEVIKGIYGTLKDSVLPAAKFLSEHWQALLIAIGAIKLGGSVSGIGKSVSKIGGNAATKIGGGIGKIGGRMAKGGIAGLAGFGLDAYRDSKVESGDWKGGGFGDYATSMGAKALEYGAIGSILGPWGAAIGGLVGAGMGAWDAYKRGKEADANNAANPQVQVKKFSEGGIVEGNSYQGDNLTAQVNSGEMILNTTQQKTLFDLFSDVMHAPRVNTSVSNVINSNKPLISNVANKGTDALQIASFLSPMAALVGTAGSIVRNNADNKISMRDIAEKTLSLTNPIIALTKAVGLFDNKNAKTTVTEKLVSPKPLGLNEANSIVAKPVGEKEYIYTPTSERRDTVNGNEITVKDFNINISGTIKLDGGSSSKNIDVKSLLNDPSFVASLRDVIKASINTDMNGGRMMSDISTLRGGVSNKTIWNT